MAENRISLTQSTPANGDTMEGAHASPETLELLWRRRSTVAKDLEGPGPDDEQIEQLLTIAARVPDHGKLAPWRFVLFQGAARGAFGEHLEAAFRAANPEASDELAAMERDRFQRAPLVIAVLSTAGPHAKIPEWEQVLSAGAVCQNLLIAARAMGFAAQWLTEWYAYDAKVLAAMGAHPSEKVAGYIYIGAAAKPPLERARPPLSERRTDWRAAP